MPVAPGGSGTVPDTYGSGTLNVSHPTMADSLSYTNPAILGSGTRTLSHPTLSASAGTQVIGSGSPRTSHPTLTSALSSSSPNTYVSGSKTLNHPIISGAATTQTSGSIIGSPALNHPTISRASTTVITPINHSAPFFVHGLMVGNNPSGLNLFVKANDTPPTKVFTNYPSGTSLGQPNSPTLFVRGSTNRQIVNLPPLYINGVWYSTNHTLNLFVANVSSSGTVPLYMYGNTTPTFNVNFSANLYTHGSSPLSYSVPLYINGPKSVNNSVPLFLKTATPTNNSLPLSLLGATTVLQALAAHLYIHSELGHLEGINLFIQGPITKAINNNIPLSVTGYSHRGRVIAAPLSMRGEGGVGQLDLFIAGVDKGKPARSLSLFITGRNFQRIRSSPMFIQNLAQGAGDSIPLYVGADGMWAGYSLVSDSINLYVQRGAQQAVPLIVCNNWQVASSPLFVAGSPLASGSVPLFILPHGGSPTNHANLSIAGGVSTSINNNTKLVIPQVFDRISQLVALYVNGFKYPD